MPDEPSLLRKLVAGLIVLGVVGAVGVLVWPLAVHALDRGHETVTVEKLAGGYVPGTRNLAIEGVLAVEFIVEYTSRDADRGKMLKRQSYIPLVTPGWSPSQPVAVVFLARAWAGYRLADLAKLPSQKGIARTAFTEGMSDSVVAEFEKMGVKLAPNVLLLEEIPTP